MEIFNDFLSENHVEDIENVLMSVDVPWYNMVYGTVGSNNLDEYYEQDNNIIDNPQFTHLFYNDGEIRSEHYSYLVLPMIRVVESIKRKKLLNNIIRAKANLLYKNEHYPENAYNKPHTDNSDFETETLLYYVNNSEGDTFIFNEKKPVNNVLTLNQRVSPEKGKMLFFDSSYLHAGSPPRKTDFRVVINIVFAKDY